MNLKAINFESIEDRGTKEAFKIVKQALGSEPMVNANFKLIEVVFTAAGTFKVAHSLGFEPKDVIQTSLIGSGALTWNYAKFDSTNLEVTVTGPCTVRAFVGAYRNG